MDVEYGHRLGLKVMQIVRMNDLHDQFKYELSRYKKKNLQLIGCGQDPMAWGTRVQCLPLKNAVMRPPGDRLILPIKKSVSTSHDC
jgi:hypothetical protein